ncbi:Hexuronic acid methyltransferase AglP [uncultured archaeon]|nr:Hexuronic acid methyltransferase AglP [uncultured archaeon]
MYLSEARESYNTGRMSKSEYIEERYKQNLALFELSEFIRETDIASIKITDGLVTMTTRSTGIRLACEFADKRSAPLEALNFGNYEKTEWEMLRRMMGKSFVVWDIGANVGWYALNLARLFPQARVLAFEPIPSTFRHLERNVQINNLSNIYIYNFGFSDGSGHIKFYLPSKNSANASFANLSGDESALQVICQVMRMDDFAEESDLKMDLVKCDVEGAELLVLKGGAGSIERYKPVIFTEMLRKWSAKFEYHPNQIIGLLGDMGYRCFTTLDQKLVEFFHMDEATTETNFFFLHSDKHSLLIDALCRKD